MRLTNCTGFVVFVGILSVMAAPNVTATEQSDWTKTTIRLVEHRLSMVETLRGRVLLRTLLSDSTARARSKERSAAAVKAGLDPADMPPMGKDIIRLVDFDYDVSRDQWRYEVVDLGDITYYLPEARLPRLLNVELDPSYYYQASICDGEKIYTYERRSNEGWVNDRGSGGQPDDLWRIRSEVIAALDMGTFYNIKSHGYVVTPDGEETMHGVLWRKLRVTPPAGEETGLAREYVVRLWIAPSLDYAAVREEHLVIDPDKGNPPVLYVTMRDDFVQLVPDLWCPRHTTRDTYVFGAEHDGAHARYGREAWKETRMLWWDQQHGADMTAVGDVASLDLQANIPLAVITPFAYPFDAQVYDMTGGPVRGSPSIPIRRLVGDVLPAPESYPLSIELATESALNRWLAGQE